ncbi:hypothetical protein ACFL0P_05915 [Candidatus Omnitrophota bacterium]
MLKSKIFIILLLGVLTGGITAYSPAYTFTLIIFLSGLLIGFLCIKLSNSQDTRFLITIFLTGYLLRILISLALYLYASQFEYREAGSFAWVGFFIGDGLSYFSNGRDLSKLWEIGIFPDMSTFKLYYAPCPTVSTYCYFNGLIMHLAMGRNPVMLFFINCIFGALSILLIYFITLRLVGMKVARCASVLYCFWPSLILWSTQNLKEPMYAFMVLLLILSMLILIERFNVRYMLLAFLASYVLVTIRPPMALTVAVLFFIFYLIFMLKRKKNAHHLLASLIFGLICFLILSSFSGFLWIKEFIPSWEHLNTTFLLKNLTLARSVRAFGGSAILPQLEFTSLWKLLFFIPVATLIVFFMPFPWQVGSAMQMMAFPEMLIWYALLPFTVRGFIYAFKKDRQKTIIISTYVLTVALILGIAEGNVGTLFRHRSTVISLCLIFTGIGICLKKDGSLKKL